MVSHKSVVIIGRFILYYISDDGQKCSYFYAVIVIIKANIMNIKSTFIIIEIIKHIKSILFINITPFSYV